MSLSSIVCAFARGMRSTPSKKTALICMGPFIRNAPLCEGAIKFISTVYSSYWSVSNVSSVDKGLEPSKYKSLTVLLHGQEECGNPGCVDDVRCYVHKGDAPLPSLDRPYIFCWVMGVGGEGG